MKTNTKLIILAALLLGLWACNNQDENAETDLAVPVSVLDIKPASISKYVNTTGTVLASYQVDLTSEIAGHYKLLINTDTGKPFKLGDRVKKGQKIIRIEDDEYENTTAIESKKLNLDIAQQEFEKQKSLYEKGGVTLREMRNSEVQLANAKYDYENAKINMAKMTVIAPFDGVIVDLPYYTPDVRISASQPMVSMMNYHKMYMEINLPEKAITEVKTGQKVLVTNYTLPDDTLKGIVSELSPAISTETRTVKGKLLISNPELKLRPGMFIKADIVVAHKDSVVVVPKDVVITGNRGKRIFVVEKSAARERRIETGLENQEQIEIISGLKPNERLVIKGFETLRNGSKVKILK